MATESRRTSWSQKVSLTDALAGTPPPQLRVGQWSDSVDGKPVQRALFYPNEVHSVGGEPESMKSWLLLLAAQQEIKLGRHVVFVDMEASDRSIVDRLRLLGATPARIKRCFHYFRPDERLTDDDQAAMRRLVKKLMPTLVVLDGVTEAYSLNGLSINSAEDAATWFRTFARQFLVKPTPDYDGPAVVELDHVVKDRESRNGWTVGTQHKKAGIKGAMYVVEPRSPLGMGKHGVSRLLLAKDSPGGVEWVPLGRNRQRYVGDLHCDATGDGVDAWIESADPAVSSVVEREAVAPSQTPEFRQCMRAIWEYVEAHPRVSGKVIRSEVTGRGDKAKQDAIAVLEAEGHLVNEGTGNSAKWVVGAEFSLLKPVSEGGESRASKADRNRN